MIYSTGTVFEWFAAISSGAPLLGASPVDGGFTIDTTSDSLSLCTRLNDSHALFPIPYNAGSVVSRFWLCVKSDTAFNTLDFSLMSFNPGIPETPYLEVATNLYELTATTQILELGLEADLILANGRSYFLRVFAHIWEFGKITLKGYGVHTEYRSL
ncbi:MAG TPA: hypothetical protein VMW91_05535 [Desulfosporosinus sp.]|nr:hypothetical protein [Desulfosporosinus sp.]